MNLQRKHDTVGSIKFDPNDGVVQVFGSTKRVLTFRQLREASGEDQAIFQVDGPGGF